MALNLTELQAVTDDYFEKTTTDYLFREQPAAVDVDVRR